MRKQFFINKEFQTRFILFMIFVAFGTLITTWLVLRGYFGEFHELADQSKLGANHPFRELIQYQEHRMNLCFGILAGVNVAFITGIGLWMSHKIAGPIFRLVETLNHSKKGEVEFKVRETDYFQELPVALNHFLKSDFQPPADSSPVRS